MSETLKDLETWNDVLDHKAAILHSNIGQMETGLRARGIDEETITRMCQPYIALLRSMYTEDYPLVDAIQKSDFIVRIEGPAVNDVNPRISVVTGVFQKVRLQVGNVAKAIAHFKDSKRVPKEMDLGVSAFAHGSLIVGFTLPPADDVKIDGEASLLGEQDPLYLAAREAIRAIGIATQHVTNDRPDEELVRLLPDPRVRDSALVAVRELSPSKRQGINSVRLGGKQLGVKELKGLTQEDHENLVQKLTKPVYSKEVFVLEGWVREIDLDERRFELRHVLDFEQSDLRCSYANPDDEEAKTWLNRRVRARGLVDRDQSGKPRLLDVQQIEIIE